MIIMAEPGKQQMGDGQDNYGQAAKQARDAAKNIGKNAGKEAGKQAAKRAAAKGAEAAVNSAAATVKAGVETGKAVSEIAAGTAAGGPWGAIISAAWAMRHTLFKILICICLVLVLFIACIVSLPNIIFQNIGEMFGDMFGFGQVETVDINTFDASYDDLSLAVEGSVQSAYAQAVRKAQGILSDDKYDREYSKGDFLTSLDEAFDYDVEYFLAAYSVAMGQNGTSKSHLVGQLDSVSDQLFTVEATEKKKDLSVTVNGQTTTKTITYVVVTINRYNEGTILGAFGIDPKAPYQNYGITNQEYVEFLAESLRKTLAGVPEQ